MSYSQFYSQPVLHNLCACAHARGTVQRVRMRTAPELAGEIRRGARKYLVTVPKGFGRNHEALLLYLRTRFPPINLRTRYVMQSTYQGMNANSLSAELRVDPNQNSVFLPPRNELPTQTSLSCRLQVTPPGQRLFVEWVVQNGETSTHFFVRFGILRNGYSMLLIGDEMFLFIDDLSYKRAGNYTCRARLTADVLSPFQLATISLFLKREYIPVIISCNQV